MYLFKILLKTLKITTNKTFPDFYFIICVICIYLNAMDGKYCTVMHPPLTNAAQQVLDGFDC